MDPLTEAEAWQVLRDAPVAHVGVIADGEPYVTPMSFVVDEGRILFRTKPGRRHRALVDNPKVSIEASRFDPSNGDWVSVVISGRAEECTDQERCLRVVGLLLEKYRQALGSPFGREGMQAMASFPHVIEVTVDEMTGMSSGRGFSPRTRPGRL